MSVTGTDTGKHHLHDDQGKDEVWRECGQLISEFVTESVGDEWLQHEANGESDLNGTAEDRTIRCPDEFGN